MKQMKPSTHEYARFLDHVVIDDRGGCWLWQSVNRTTGYGQYRCPRRGRVISAHRWMYQFHNPDQILTKRDFVMHTCDVKHCVNPTHLMIGDHATNMADMRRKGRAKNNPTGCKGQLSAEQVREIRQSQLPRVTLAEKFGISYQQVYKIINRVIYKDVM